ncbi:MAG: peptide chain release factor N(5)-glutamine methyltransferase [Alphaproteobacteria bacterium]|nr:peptide chain release factor N(5)-glutamine methyltransferase [Alphaproteobacteria bacterium]
MTEPQTVKDLYKTLKQHMSDNDARYVLRKRAGLDYSDLISKPDTYISEEAIQAIKQDLELLQDGKPLSKIYGEREFWGLSFTVTEHTLDPRPDTETLVEAVLKSVDRDQPLSILDLGTGSGCILISLLSELPHAQGVGVDISESALATAQENAKRNHVAERCSFLLSDWDEKLTESFDIVVSNPPYIASAVIPTLQDSVKKHDPILALDGGEDGLQAYKKIFSCLSRVLKPHGKAYFEIGYDQSETVTRLSRESRFSIVESHADFAGHTRVLEVCPDECSGDK